MDIVFAASGEFALPSMRALIAAGHRLVRVYSQPDRPAGRGNRLTATAVSEPAKKCGLELVKTASINAEETPKADLLVVIAFGQKISASFIERFGLGAMNLHASRLPKYRGAAPINWAMLHGERVTGNSIIRLAERMDAGAILAQSEVAIGALETAGELHDRLAEDGAELLRATVDRLGAGKSVEVAQDETLATHAPKLSRDQSRLEWSGPAEEIARRIRALHPWPGCRVRLLDEHGAEVDRLTLVRARGVGSTDARPGMINGGGLVGAGDGRAVEVIELQPAGKRIMEMADYRRGNAWAVGMRLESLG